jgi:TolB-like protein
MGEFLEGFDIAEEGFEDWLRAERTRPAPDPGVDPAAAPAAMPVVALAPHAPPQPQEEQLRPRVAVLPALCFGLSEQYDGLGDFVAQDLVRALGRLQLLDVISHLSSRAIAAETVDVAQVRDRLGADYLVTGAIRMIGGRFVIQIDFADCAKGLHLWDGRFSIPEAALFEQGEGIISEIAGEILRVVLAESAQAGANLPLPNVETHRLLMSAISLMYHVTERPFASAQERLFEVTRRAPGHSVPQAWSAQWYLLKIYQGWSEDPLKDRSIAEDHINRGLDMNPACALTLAMDGNVKTVLNSDFAAATESFASSLAVNQSSAVANTFKSVLHTFQGQGAEAVTHAERSMILSPCDPRKHFFDALHAAAFLVSGDYQRAVDLASSSLDVSPRHISAHRSKIVGLSLGGQDDQARRAAQDLMRITPSMTVTDYLQNHPAKGTGVAAIWADALLRAGVPEN